MPEGIFIGPEIAAEILKTASMIIKERKQELAEAIVDRQYSLQPEIWEKYGEAGRKHSLQDAGYHLSYLSEALSVSDPALFTEYVAWVKTLFKNLNFPDSALPGTLECIREVLEARLPKEIVMPVSEYLEAGFRRLTEAPEIVPSYIDEGDPGSSLARQYLNMLLSRDRNAAYRLIVDAVNGGMDIRDIYLQVFQRTQYEVGRLWQTNRISVAQEHYCTAATQLIMAQLYPRIFSTKKRGRLLVAACVGEELHEIGIRMVADFFEMEGWDTIYLGANTPTRSIVGTVKDSSADVLAISATMTFHVSAVRELIAAVKGDPDARKVKIIVGGYPFNLSPGIWQSLEADGYAGDARQAVEMANKLVGD